MAARVAHRIPCTKQASVAKNKYVVRNMILGTSGCQMKE